MIHDGCTHHKVDKWTAIAASASVLSGCTFQSIEDSCTFPASIPFYDNDPGNLEVLVATTDFSPSRLPYLWFSDTGEEHTLKIDLIEVSQSSESGSIALGANCSKTETRAYELDVSAEDWISFWDKAEQNGRFRGAVAFPVEKTGFYPADAIGFALIDQPSASAVWACGCLAE